MWTGRSGVVLTISHEFISPKVMHVKEGSCNTEQGCRKSERERYVGTVRGLKVNSMEGVENGKVVSGNIGAPFYAAMKGQKVKY